MPIVTVDIVAGAHDAMDPGLAQLLADAIGGALHSPPGKTWVRVRSVTRGDYAENHARLDDSQLPVFIAILQRQTPPRAELEREVSVLTHAVAKAIGRPPACVHIEYAPAAAGRLSFGGTLVQ